ncbi:hypothetical protein JL721_4039 [Aureococcus anophagefferens]|nr:hypothetical protein JL721_4039 [Aureococcus anophagefferens]
MPAPPSSPARKEPGSPKARASARRFGSGQRTRALGSSRPRASGANWKRQPKDEGQASAKALPPIDLHSRSGKPRVKMLGRPSSLHVPGAVGARAAVDRKVVGNLNSRGTRWLDAATVGRVNAKLFIQARYQSEKQKKAVLDRVAGAAFPVSRPRRELFNGDSDSDDDSVEEAREARRHAKQAGVPAGRLGFVMPKGHGPGDYGKPLVEDLGDYLKPLGDEDYDTLKDFLRAWRSAAVEQRNFAASSHRMATPENEGFAAYGAMSAEEAEFFEQPDSVIKLVFGAWREDTLKIRARRLRKREKHVEARKVHRRAGNDRRNGPVHRMLAREMRAGKQPARGAYHVNKVLAGASVKDLKASRVTLASKDVKALDWRRGRRFGAHRGPRCRACGRGPSPRSRRGTTTSTARSASRRRARRAAGRCSSRRPASGAARREPRAPHAAAGPRAPRGGGGGSRDEAAAAAGRRGGAEAREAPVPVSARVAGVADAPREDAARAGLRPRRPGRPARRRVLGGRGQRLVSGGVRRAIRAGRRRPRDQRDLFNNTDAASVRTAQPPTLEQAALATYASSRRRASARRSGRCVLRRAVAERAAPQAPALRRRQLRQVQPGHRDHGQRGRDERAPASGQRRRPRDSAAEYSTAGAASLFSSLYSAATAPSTSSFIAACSTKVVGVVTANLFGPTMLQAAALFGAAPPAAAPAADLGGGDPPSVVAPVEPGGNPRRLALADHPPLAGVLPAEAEEVHRVRDGDGLVQGAFSMPSLPAGRQ